jgi:hypothetical protein
VKLRDAYMLSMPSPCAELDAVGAVKSELCNEARSVHWISGMPRRTTVEALKSTTKSSSCIATREFQSRRGGTLLIVGFVCIATLATSDTANM